MELVLLNLNTLSRCLLLFFSAALMSSAYAGEVKRIQKKGKRYVIVKSEEGDGLAKGASACAFDGDTEVTCGGKVRRVSKKGTAYVYFKKSLRKKIKKGMIIRAQDGDEALAGEQGVSGSSDYKGKKAPLRFWAGWSGGLLHPVTFQKLVYEVPTTTDPSTLWVQDELVASQLAVKSKAIILLIGMRK
jgi:hypothetical protein